MGNAVLVGMITFLDALRLEKSWRADPSEWSAHERAVISQTGRGMAEWVGRSVNVAGECDVRGFVLDPHGALLVVLDYGIPELRMLHFSHLQKSGGSSDLINWQSGE